MRVWAWLMAVLVVAGCDRQPGAGRMATPAPASAAAPSGGRLSLAGAQIGPGLHLAYTHDIGLELPGDVLAAHFAASRDTCVNDAALHCLLLHAEIGPPHMAYSQRGAGSLVVASLQVRLPHDQVARFSAALTAPLPGEAAGLVRVVQQASTADDLGQPVADAAQRVGELTGYLASLKVLGARLTISVSDQVKVAEETARAQTQLEEAQVRQRELSLRTDTEELDVEFSAAVPAVAPAPDPVTLVLAGAQDSLRRNAADALAFGIAALPWVPVGVVGLVVLWVARRVVFGRRARRVVVE